MHVIAVYNNKGGVGKSTLTVGLAEFLAGNQRKRVLVIDLDGQASSSDALLGSAVKDAIANGRTIAALADEAHRTRKKIENPDDFFTDRPGASARGSALGSLSVLVPDKEKIVELEERMRQPKDAHTLRKYLKPALTAFDFVLIDLPGNADRRHTMVLNALVMSDFVLIPIEPTQLALGALPATFDLIHYAQTIGGDGRPAPLGMVLNKTDKREQQFKAKFPAIDDAAKAGQLPPVFENFLPDASALRVATDATMDFRTLKERFATTYYDKVRLIARELTERCEHYRFEPQPEQRRFGQRWREILEGFWTRRR